MCRAGSVRRVSIASKRGLAGSASGTTARGTRYGTRSVPTDSIECIDGDDFCKISVLQPQVIDMILWLFLVEQ